MSKDIGPLLEAWPLNPEEQLTTRKIIGRDGAPRIQLRLDMGLIQMSFTGRPDGARPYGCESLLAYFQEEANRCCVGGGEFRLDSQDCAALQHESMLYYHRRLCCLRLEEFAQAAADAQHNLDLMDLVKEYAEDDDDRFQSERFRAFVLGHRTSALARQALKERGRLAALHQLDEGEAEILEVLAAQINSWEDVSNRPEVQSLRRLRAQIEKEAPLTDRERLERRLKQAVLFERYEEAARLRDALRATA